MANEISLSLFEKNAREYNKKGLERSYIGITDNPTEYAKQFPIGITATLVIEASIDKDYVEKFQEILTEMGYEVLGSNNTFFIGEIVRQYLLNVNSFDDKAKEGLEALSKDYEAMKTSNQKYIVNEDGDAVFYFLPFNKEIKDIVSFIDNVKDNFKSFAEENDVTLMLKLNSYDQALTGFIGFNFFSEENGKEVTVDFYTTSSVAVDFANPAKVVSGAIILRSLCGNREDFDFLQIHILADNYRFKN